MTMNAGFWQAHKKDLTSTASDIYPLRSEIDDSDETARFPVPTDERKRER
jgi:hypothetical protein